MTEKTSPEGLQKKKPGFQVHENPILPPSPDTSNTPVPALSPDSHPLDHLGELPHTYQGNHIVLMAQGPHCLFAYWDFDISRHPGGKLFLRSCDAAAHIETEAEVAFETQNWYLPAAHANAHYFVELGYYRGQIWHSIGRSNSIQTPQDRLSGDESLDYAVLPLHVSFQRMLEQLAKFKRPDEPLISALSRLRQEGKLFGMDAAFFGGEAELNVAFLELLLGKDLARQLSSEAMSSEQIENLIHERLALYSSGSSEVLALAEESLSSNQIFRFLFSWYEAVGSSGGMSSFPELQGISSFEQFREALSSWSAPQLSSWFQHAFSSWSQGALSSLALSSLSSWGGSETSSWGGRSFFMHVNAEVIFYGGTDPKAKVWIDGQPIDLNLDGTFRYHFRFADRDYEIPIVAQSPDGVETRSAVLHFKRQTERTAGVDNTGQPPHLIEPMGAKK